MKQPQKTKTDVTMQELRQRIQSGYYPAGSRLASDRDLAVELECSRMTMRVALQRLQVEGLIEIVPKSGTYVCAVLPHMEIGSRHPLCGASPSSFREGAEQESLTYVFEPAAIQQADLALAQKLGIKEGVELVHRAMLVSRNQRPVRFVEWLIPQAIVVHDAGLLQSMMGSTPYLGRWLGGPAFGANSSAYERLVCRFPTPQEAHRLCLSRSQSVVEIERWIWQEPGVLGMYTFLLHNAAWHGFTYTYNAAQWPDLMQKILDES